MLFVLDIPAPFVSYLDGNLYDIHIERIADFTYGVYGYIRGHSMTVFEHLNFVITRSSPPLGLGRNQNWARLSRKRKQSKALRFRNRRPADLDLDRRAAPADFENRHAPIDYTLNNSLGFGDSNCCLVLGVSGTMNARLHTQAISLMYGDMEAFMKEVAEAITQLIQ